MWAELALMLHEAAGMSRAQFPDHNMTSLSARYEQTAA
jgi:hypothetical protein